jgi:cell division septation protein DedD
VRTAAVAAPAAPLAPTAVRAAAPVTRQIQVQVASVRSREAAATVADRLRKEHGFRLDSREPVIEEKVYGNMGTFYAVKVGPYPDQTEPNKLCQVLRPTGYDCMVLTE